MNNREAAIISAYTGISFGGSHFQYFHQYAEEKFGHAIWTHEMADERFWQTLKELAKDDFIQLAKSLC